jgi:hypothetical protein
MLKNFKRLDFFGRSINLTYKSRQKFQTNFGAFSTVIMMTVMLYHAIDHAFDIGEVKTILKEEIIAPIGTYLNPGEFNFEMAFGFR